MLKGDIDAINSNIRNLSNGLFRESSLVEIKRLLEKIKVTNDSQQINNIINKISEIIQPPIILQEDPFSPPEVLPPLLDSIEIALGI